MGGEAVAASFLIFSFSFSFLILLKVNGVKVTFKWLDRCQRNKKGDIEETPS